VIFLNSLVMVKNIIQPLFDNVLIKPLEAELKTASGIILPETAQQKPQTGEVIAVGPGRVTIKGEKEPMMVKPGQKVVYKKWGGSDVKLNGEELVLVEQKDILAIVK
jgi:chaperonin GroES